MEDKSAAPARPSRLAADVDGWLRAGAGGAPCERVIETSISWIFLCPDRALKLKKPLDLGFLDFTTAEKRRWAAERELAFNKATAPDIYRRVRAITRDAGGALSLDGPGEAVDYALEMRRFDENATLAGRLGAIDASFAEALGRQIARYHGQAPQGAAGGGGAGLGYVLRSNAHLLRGEAADLGGDAVERLLGLTEQAFQRLTPLLDRRRDEGFVRCCHGDLHLGNILLEAEKPILFDCIEFNDALREIDVLYDIAFLLMDLGFRGADEAANRVMNGWFDEAARHFPAGLWEGLAALPLFQAVRATVRAHVNALERRPEEGRRYLAAAEAFLRPAKPMLVAIGGLSGSGKSTLARALAPALGAAPGAVVLRSDEIRKRLWGLAPAERAPPPAYTREASARVYDELCRIAGVCLAAGRAVITDAVFLREEERERIESVTSEAGTAFHGLWLEAPTQVLQQRITARRNDASDADARVLRLQLAEDPGAIAWRRHTEGASPAAVRELQRVLEPR